MEKIKDGFEKWIMTGEGIDCSNIKTLTGAQFLKNRLWWAYKAGEQSNDIHLTTEVEQIFEDLISLPKYRLPVGIHQKIKYVLDHKTDYTIHKL